jgi:hypothetical protein
MKMPLVRSQSSRGAVISTGVEVRKVSSLVVDVLTAPEARYQLPAD